MILKKINIQGFKSIEDETFEIVEIDGSKTYALIGINESGKSSFLKAVSLIKEGQPLYPQDYFDEQSKLNQIQISLYYNFNSEDEKELIKTLTEKGLDKQIVSILKIEEIVITAKYEPSENPQKQLIEQVKFNPQTFSDYTFDGTNVIKKDPTQTQEDLDVEKYFKALLPDYFSKKIHEIIFWKSDNKYLINEAINLDTFSTDPKNTSVPLFNCFTLAGINDIQGTITKIKNSPSATRDLQDKLGDKVTAHIKKIWPDHPIKIKFQINNMAISFLVEDKDVKYSSKTTSQRSDGFRQFISFLLTISAQSANVQLSNTILLLDEPETHLHPTAQEDLRDELIKITTDKRNNITFFATHSNYMIDKNNLGRCFRVVKKGNKRTKLERIDTKITSYSEVNYEVFEIATNDYHNELYGFLWENDKDKLDKLPKKETWQNEKTSKDEKVSLSTFIRHSIHHPENTSNRKFTNSQLIESIRALRKLKYNKA